MSALKQADWLRPTLENDDDEDMDVDDEEPPPLVWNRPELSSDWRRWLIENADAIDELYACYKEAGRRLFGRAFNQCGTYGDFAQYVYAKLQPGA